MTAPIPARAQRYDIQVLRALAVGGVVVNHLFPNRLTGGYLGVDIFFVISGFLITSHLVSELEREDRVSLARFWARRARRLLPAALTVLAVCAAATVAWIPQTRWPQVMDEILASTLYFQNWQLAASAQNYFTSAQSPSPVTHYWSLSVEEQFYLVWPLLALVVWWLAGRGGPGVGRTTDAVAARRRLLAVALTVLGVLSLAFATWSLDAWANAAYFLTPGRAWEFAAGAVLGALPSLRALPRAAAVPGWVAMVASMWFFGDGSGVPGLLTLVPVAGAVLVLWAGVGTAGRPTPLVLRAPAWVGDISYSVYLWHWPLIVFAPYALDRPMTPTLGVVLLLATLAISHASARLVEEPFRTAGFLVRGPSWRTLAGAAAGMAVVAGAAAYVPSTVTGSLKDVQARLDAMVREGGRCVGANAAENHCPDSHELSVVDSDLVNIMNSPYYPAWGGTCQVEPEDASPAPCEFGTPPEEAGQRLALVGDSHAGHWASALDVVAQERGWHVSMHVKSSCVPVADGFYASWSTPAAVKSCRAWGEQVRPALADDPELDVIVMSAIARDYTAEDADEAVRLLREMWQEWVDAGKDVVVIGDVPYLDKGSVPECLAASDVRRDPCATPRSKVRIPDPFLEAAKGQPGVTVMDPVGRICDERTCHAVVGGLPVYGDQNHLLQYFARTLAPLLEDTLEGVTAEASSQGSPQGSSQGR